MKPQIPAEGITLNRDFGDSKFYSVACSCGNPDDAIDFYVEIDSDMMDVTVNTSTTQKTDYWTEKFKAPHYDNAFINGCYKFANALWTRLRLTKNIWLDGYVKYSSYTIMSKQQALNYAETLKTAVAEVESHKLEQRGRRDLITEIESLKEEVARLKWAANVQD